MCGWLCVVCIWYEVYVYVGRVCMYVVFVVCVWFVYLYVYVVYS